jgi:hypothetical protein
LYLLKKIEGDYLSAFKELRATIDAMEQAGEEGRSITPDDLQRALDQLGWKQADLWRNAGLNKDTPSRWLGGKTPIPLWVSAYLGTLLEIRRLHEKYLRPPRQQPADGAS